MFGIVLRDVEQVGVQRWPEGRDQEGGAHEPAHPRDHRAGGHHGAGGRGCPWSRGWCRWAAPGRSCPWPSADPPDQAYGDRAEQQRDPGAEDHPDHAGSPGPTGSAARPTEPSGVPSSSVTTQLRRCARRAGRSPPRSRTDVLLLGRDVDRLRRVDGHRLRRLSDCDLHRDRVVEPVGERGREPAAAAGQGHRARRLDRDRAEPAGDPRAGSGRRRRGRSSGRPGCA